MRAGTGKWASPVYDIRPSATYLVQYRGRTRRSYDCGMAGWVSYEGDINVPSEARYSNHTTIAPSIGDRPGSSISNRFEEAMMVNATRQTARDPRDSSKVTYPTPAVVRSLGSLEHLFWLADQHHFVHFAVTAL